MKEISMERTFPEVYLALRVTKIVRHTKYLM